MAYIADNREDSPTRTGAWTMALEGSCTPGWDVARRTQGSTTAAVGEPGDVASPLGTYAVITVKGGRRVVVDRTLSSGFVPEDGVSEGRLVLRVESIATGEAEGLLVIPSMGHALWEEAVSKSWQRVDAARAARKAGTKPPPAPKPSRPLGDLPGWPPSASAPGSGPAGAVPASHFSAPLWSRKSTAEHLEAGVRSASRCMWGGQLSVRGMKEEDAGRLWRTEEKVHGAITNAYSRVRKAYVEAARAHDGASGEDDGIWSLPDATRQATRLVPMLSSLLEGDSNTAFVQALLPVCNVKMHVFWVPLTTQNGTTADGSGAARVQAVLREATAAAASEGAVAAGSRALRLLEAAWTGDAFWGRVRARAAAVDARVRAQFGAAPDDPSSASASAPAADDTPKRRRAPRKRRSGPGKGRDTTQAAMARYAVGNLVGSISQYRGRQLVLQADGSSQKSKVHELLTGCPSRSRFPRGFFWDEGFHQLVTARFDPLRSAEVLSSWFNTMNEDGWMAREQILGPEARSRVPPEFQVQKPDVANPPTLLLAVQEMLMRLLDGRTLASWRVFRDAETKRADAEWAVVAEALTESSGERLGEELVAAVTAAGAEEGFDRADVAADGSSAPPAEAGAVSWSGELPALTGAAQTWLTRHYSLLARYYRWLKTSQAAPTKGFQWKGDKPDDAGHTFASGMDDYPRGAWHTASDRHVDLTAWMAWAAGLMGRLARAVMQLEAKVQSAELAASARADLKEFQADLFLAKAALEDHWNAKRGYYCDIGLSPRYAEAVHKGELDPASTSLPVTHVCHEGYISVFPLLLGLVDANSTRLAQLLVPLQSEQRIGSPYGLRSLSQADPLHRSGDDYWRGKIWANINFLAIHSLNELAQQPGPLAEQCGALAKHLHRGMFRAVHQEWVATGTLWENYDTLGGVKGTGTHPFTGWTALIASMPPPTA